MFSLSFPHLLHTDFINISVVDCIRFFRSVFAAIPEGNSRRDQKKNGRKTGGGRFLWKSLSTASGGREGGGGEEIAVNLHRNCGTWNMGRER
jgi:hypothetical protein